jgi:hypothetical protein
MNKKLIQPTRSKTFFDWLLFFMSSAIIAGVIIGFRPLNWVTISGFALALFWMLVSAGLRGALQAYAEERKELVKMLSELGEEEKK